MPKTGPLPKINDHTLALAIAREEGKKKSEDIAQIKEQLKITKALLRGFSPFRVIKWLHGKK